MKPVVQTLIRWLFFGSFGLLALAVVVVLIAPDKDSSTAQPNNPVPFTFAHELSEADRADVQRALNLMLANCPSLAREGNVDSIRVEYWEPGVAERKSDYGWTREITFRVKVQDWPHTELSNAAGHTLHIALGGGRHPGIFTKKDLTRPICGTGGFPPGHDAFKSVPDATFIK